MRLNSFIEYKDFPTFTDYIYICERTTPLPDSAFKAMKSAGDKLGIRLKKSDTVWDYLKRAGKGLNQLMTSMGIYLSTDITNKPLKKKLVNDMKKQIKSIDKKELMAFLFQIDKASFGITAHIRHVLQSLLGVEVATYNKWLEDYEYMEKELKHIKVVLNRIGASQEEMEALKNFQNTIMNLKGKK